MQRPIPPRWCSALMRDIEQVQRGALVLFTSRAQMRAATDALPGHLLDMVLVQGTQSRTRLLAAHMARVEAGLPSVIFGLQSFGEGLDLPGALCETVFITKLPFAPPVDPVDEARAEWLRKRGARPVQRTGDPRHRHQAAAMDRPRHSHRGRPRRGHLLRQATGDAKLWQAHAGRVTTVPGGAAQSTVGAQCGLRWRKAKTVKYAQKWVFYVGLEFFAWQNVLVALVKYKCVAIITVAFYK